MIIIPRAVGMPSVKDGAQVTNVEEAADPLINPPVPEAPYEANDEFGGKDEITIRNLRQEAKSLRHLLTHKPANKYCDACILGNAWHKEVFYVSYERSRQPTRWLELGTADHLVAQSGSMEGITGDCDATIIKDLLSKVKALFPFFSM